MFGLDLSAVDWPRRSRQLLLFLIICVFISSVALVFACFSNDRAIQANQGSAVAQVRSVELLRTAVDYVDENGEFQSPPQGLLYPVGLEAGQRVRVEYDRTNPDLVRVVGRRWTLSIIPAASIVVVALVIAAPLWWLSVRATRRLRERSPKVNQASRPGSPDLQS